MKKTKNRFQDAVRRHLKYSAAKVLDRASTLDWFHAVSLAAREFMIDGMLATDHRFQQQDAKRLYYLSIEFLMGRTLGNTLYNLKLYDLCKDVLIEMGVDLEEVRAVESDAALGNGGLGRLAACFLDSLASQSLPGFGYGINYEFGLFKQQIVNGYQREKPDFWAGQSSPWLIERPARACLVPLYGRVAHTADKYGEYNPMWLDWRLLVGVPYDMPVGGGYHSVQSPENNAAIMDGVRNTYDGPLALARDLMVINVTRDLVKVRMATVDEYVLPPDVTEAYKNAPRTDDKQPGEFIMEGKWKGYTPPPMPKKP